jgi:hypothetical protein
MSIASATIKRQNSERFEFRSFGGRDVGNAIDLPRMIWQCRVSIVAKIVPNREKRDMSANRSNYYE